MNHYRSSSL